MCIMRWQNDGDKGISVEENIMKFELKLTILWMSVIIPAFSIAFYVRDNRTDESVFFANIFLLVIMVVGCISTTLIYYQEKWRYEKEALK